MKEQYVLPPRLHPLWLCNAVTVCSRSVRAEQEGFQTDPQHTALPDTVFIWVLVGFYLGFFWVFLTPVFALGLIHLCAVLLYSFFMCFGVIL